MRSRLSIFVIAACAVAVVACRHHQNVVAPQVAPTTHAAVQAPTPMKVESPANEFKSTAPNPEDLGDAVHATEIADQKGWLRDAFFDFDSARLREDARDNLNDSAKWLENHPKYNLLIEGHCDERGTEQYNLALGDKRANDAKQYLAVVGYDPAHIKTISYGKDRPFDNGHNEEAWSKNRRAHLVLTQ